MIDLKQFALQVQQLRMADERLDDVLNRIPITRSTTEEEDKAVEDLIEIRRQLRSQVDASIDQINSTEVRIAPEQIEADKTLHSALEASLKGWQEELNLIQKESVDQAIIDAKEGNRSNRYMMLEKREQELKRLITEAEQKLGKVAERVGNPSFNDQVSTIVNAAK